MSDIRNELQDRFADAAMELFLNRYAQDEGERLWESYQSQKEAEAMPDALDQKCQRLITKTHKRTLMDSTLKRAVRIAACFLILITLTFQLVMSVEAFRIPVLNFILKQGKEFSQISFSQNESSFSAMDQLRMLIWMAVPDGYRMEYENVNTNTKGGTETVTGIIVRFQNEQDEVLDITVWKAGGSISIDSEDADITSMELYGQQAFVVSKDGELRAMWLNEDQKQIYSVIGYDTGPDPFWECVHTLAKATRNPEQNISF